MMKWPRMVPAAILLFILPCACSNWTQRDSENHHGHRHEEKQHIEGQSVDHEDQDRRHEQNDNSDSPKVYVRDEEEHVDHDGHEHGEFDPNLSIEKLFEQKCEHQTESYKCDECRYEFGIVKVPDRLIKDGLIKTIRAESKSVGVPLRLTGEVKFDDRRVTHISTQVSGVIRKVHVALGERVTAGQALLEIESVEIGNSKAVYQEALAMKKLAEKNFERIDKLEKEGISSEKESLLAKQELDAANIRVTAAEGVLSRLGMSGSRKGSVNADGSSGRLVLRASGSGTVLEMHAVSGEIASANHSLLTIGENSTLWVWADLYEKNYAMVMEAQEKGALEANIEVKAFPKEKFPGVVDYLSPAMSEISRTIKVRISVPNPDGKLLAGMFAEVDVFIPGDEKTLSLPSSAVLKDEEEAFVFVHHREEFYVRRQVETGRDIGHWVEIKDGLKGTELVIAKGAFLLKSDVLRSKMGEGCAH